MKYILALLCAFMVQSSAHAQLFPGKKAAEWAAAYERYYENEPGTADLNDSVNTMAFIAYVTGIAESFHAAGKICMPEHTSSGQLAAIVAKYIKANPERWHENSWKLVSAPLSQAFRCKKR
jgi:hypothetical protein